jgi:ubiquinone/menaquinone biosynthesis C-methylase UbiE
MPSISEVQRLKEVYRNYEADSLKQTQWSLNNPGNRAILNERRLLLEHLLRRNKFLPLTDKQILEIGSGNGQVLADLLIWDAKPENLYGVDLLPDRVEAAKNRYPDIHFECTNAEALNYPDGMFDIIIFFTVFSSILDGDMQKRVSMEAQRVLKRGGAILWYDFRYNNPSNSSVHGMKKEDLQHLFPNLKLSIRTITLLPPLARKLGRFTSCLYPFFSRFTILRTHYLAFLLKE